MLHATSHITGRWVSGGTDTPIIGPVTGQPVAQVITGGWDVQAALDHARQVGGPALRALGFHDRARMLKALAGYLDAHKARLFTINPATGATTRDGRVDIDGGIGTLAAYAAKGRRELPDGHVWIDGGAEPMGRTGAFTGQHIATPLQGVAVHINAFNFPVWGMLEKLAPTLLAGVPAIIKPATQTCYLTHACYGLMLEAGVLPPGAVQLVIGPLGDMLDRLGSQDVVSFTGSADTALRLRANPNLMRHSTRFMAEQDSLNAAILGPDADEGAPEWDLFLKEAVQEITTKAGQKCTAMRRLIVPQARLEAVGAALAGRLGALPPTDPADPQARLGALASLAQKSDVLAKLALLRREASLIHGDPDRFEVIGGDSAQAFLPAMLLRCDDPDAARAIHDTEAFGPLATLMPYRDITHAADLANRGGGSLVASLFTHDPDVAVAVTMASAAHHGRLYIMDRDAAPEATGHGAPMPQMVHGGPGRAGGGEELGGIRAVLHYMQRTAVQASPRLLTAITGQWQRGAPEVMTFDHPFQRTFTDLHIGETIHTAARPVTLDDIEHFAYFTGDTFYAHMDEDAARANPFFPGRVAHGYLLLSFAAGLFVQPDPGPVLANTGLNGLAFQKPVSPGDSIAAQLTVRRKTRRTDTYGEVAWAVILTNQKAEPVAEYELLTMVAYAHPA